LMPIWRDRLGDRFLQDVGRDGLKLRTFVVGASAKRADWLRGFRKTGEPRRPVPTAEDGRSTIEVRKRAGGYYSRDRGEFKRYGKRRRTDYSIRFDEDVLKPLNYPIIKKMENFRKYTLDMVATTDA
jgi:hypothetical protein